MVETKQAQQWLIEKYKNNDTTQIIIDKGVELEGKLTISDYPKLKDILLGDAKEIEELVIENCPEVEAIHVSNNKITKIEGLVNLKKLQVLSFGDNQVKEIDISQNEQLEMLHFFNNPSSLKFVNGIKGLTNLVFWNSSDTFAITKLLEQASGEDLKEIAGKLSLNVEGKTPEKMKTLINDEINKINQNTEKLNKEFSDLINDKNELDDKKLEETKNDVEKGKKYQQLVDEVANDPVKDETKKEIDQTKLADELKKAADYKKLVTGNSKLVTDDGKEISQEKIDGIIASSGDAAIAMPILGVDDLNSKTLIPKLGGSKLSDIPESETLKSILEKNKKLEDALNNVEINPDDADVEKQLIELKSLKKVVMELYGKDYEKQLRMQKYQSQVEINTNK